ncbi:hypothetical protein WDD9_006257 [Paenibacillus melissococcoides]|uniref:hypothetical protein n=1 Tax=Paenibacillus melissococcoides TaxID=2912268 RepID=UPI0021C43103|nr:hypothetical protein [Paenibacillus melissococcoides]CAH8721370.1 hypothetical protein WDD9_006257 [Paenibacillus melissococcoides]
MTAADLAVRAAVEKSTKHRSGSGGTATRLGFWTGFLAISFTARLHNRFNHVAVPDLDFVIE